MSIRLINLEKTKDINELKITLANETTKILHGKVHSSKAEKIAADVFKFGKINENLPSKKILKKILRMGVKLLELLVDNKIMSSKSEARRAINNKGVKINDLLVADENKTLNLFRF